MKIMKCEQAFPNSRTAEIFDVKPYKITYLADGAQHALHILALSEEDARSRMASGKYTKLDIPH